jgi:hypothetical protein
MKKILMLSTALILSAGAWTHAGSIVSSTITGVTSLNVDLTGLEGYGFASVQNPNVNNGIFGGGTDVSNGAYSTLTDQNVTPNVLTTVVGSYDPVVDELRAGMGAQTGNSLLRFGGTDQLTGSASYGTNGGYAGSGAGDLVSYTFSNLAAGTYSIGFYFGHTADDRTFRWTADLTGAAQDQESAQLSGLTNLDSSSSGGYNLALYTINFEAAAGGLDDLTLTVDNTGGSGGGGVFQGYTVDFTAIPEPSSFALMGLGLGALYLLRRRRS